MKIWWKDFSEKKAFYNGIIPIYFLCYNEMTKVQYDSGNGLLVVESFALTYINKVHLL